jgi:hypothetical protein
MLRIGFASLRICFTAPSFLLFFSLCFSFCHFAKLFLSGIFLTVASLFAFLFAGGFGFVRWFWRQPRLNPFLDFVRDLGGTQTEWYHPILHYMFAHRVSLMSLAVMSAVLDLLSAPVKPHRVKTLNFVIGGLLGLLLSAQHQAFLGGLVLVVVNRCLNYETLGPREVAAFGLPFFATVALQAVHFLPGKTHMPLWKAANVWDDLPGRGIFFAPLYFWASALGVFAAVSLVGVWFFPDRRLLRVYVPAVAVFAIGNTAEMQGMPLFLLYPGWMIVAAVVFIATLVRFTQVPQTEQGKGAATAWATVAFACAVASAMIGFARLRGQTRELWHYDFERIGNWIAGNVPIKAVFIGVDREFNPVSTIAGRRAVALSEMVLSGASLRPVPDEKKAALGLLADPDPAVLPKVRYYLTDAGRQALPRNWTLLHQEGRYRIFERQ